MHGKSKIINIQIYKKSNTYLKTDVNVSKYFNYRVIECKGPTNTRVYTVAVYFRGKRLAKASGHSIQQAEMSAAKEALEISHGKQQWLHDN